MKRVYGLFLASMLIVLMASTVVKAEDAKVEKGKKVKFDYTLTVDGQEIDSSEGKQPVEYVDGDGQIIPGLANQLQGLKVGDEKKITVQAKDGYGLSDPRAFKEIEKAVISSENDFEVGQVYEFYGSDGESFPGMISEVKDKTVVVDFNHPLAGKELNFDIKIVGIE